MPDAHQPSLSLLGKLGSIAVHADELLSPDNHHFDRMAMVSLLNDSEVQAWIKAMHDQALLPVKRT